MTLNPIMGLKSQRRSKRLDVLYVFIVTNDDGGEGVLRRPTPIGRQAYITDDPNLVGPMLALAQEQEGRKLRPIRIARFVREAGEPLEES